VPLRIETQGIPKWFSTLQEHFDLNTTRLEETDTSISIYLSNEITRNANIIVGRYNKDTQVGVIFDRRGSRR
jgi:hypothetical protein